MRVTIANVDLYRYELPLAASLQLGTSTLRHRRGLLVRVEAEQGAVGWGDAAPLPGFSAETLSDVVSCARETAPRWAGTEIPELEPIDHSLAFPRDSEGPASLRFATESAVVELLAAIRRTSVSSVLGDPQSTVALNALLTRPEDDGPAQAARYREHGYRAVKVKVGRESVEKEVETLSAICRELGDRIALRADANRSWSLEEAVAFAEATRDLSIAYVEEPLADPTRLSDLVAQTDLPVALDETTREAGPEILRDAPAVSAVVLKPTFLGLQRTRKWSRVAQETGVTPMISAAYESGIGLRMLVALASVGPDVPVGLSTYDRLATDVLRPPLRLDGPTVDVASILDSAVSVDDSRLDLIDSYST